MKTLILALALLMLMLCGYPQLKAAPKNDTSSRHPEQGNGVVTSGTDSGKTASDQNTASANDQKRDHGNVAPPAVKPFDCSERLRQWWDSRTTADWTLYVTALYLIATVLIWLAMLASNKHSEKTYKESKSAAEEDRKLLRRQLEAYDRPWVTGLIEAHTHLSFDEAGCPWLTPLLILKNTGSSVATDIRYEVSLFPNMMRVGGLEIERMKVNDPQALFPGEESRQLVYLAVSKELMDAASVIVEDDAQYVKLIIDGEITYRYPTSESSHTTQFAYDVGRFEQGKARIVVRIGETIPPDEITFLREPLASYAD